MERIVSHSNQNLSSTISRSIHPALQLTLFNLVGLVSLITNLIIIFVISTNKIIKTRSNQLLINLAASDILVVIVSIPIQSVNIVLKKGPLTVDLFCQLHGALILMSFLFSNFNLCLIAVYRYLLVVKKKFHDAVFSKVKLPIICLGNYIIVILIALPSVLGWGKVKYNTFRGHCMVVWEHSLSYLLFVQLFSFTIPLVIIGFCYYNVIRHTNTSRKRLSTNIDRLQSVSKLQELRLTFMLLMVMGCFFLCFTPYTILLFYEGVFHNRASETFSFCAMFFAYFNGILDFFIYSVMNAQFRNVLKNSLTKANLRLNFLSCNLDVRCMEK